MAVVSTTVVSVAPPAIGRDLHADASGLASAMVNTLRQAGQVSGVAVLGALVYARLPATVGTGGP